MKKIGIVTWHYLDNYGSLLQTYALSESLKKFNLNVKVVNYINENRNPLIKDAVKKIIFSFCFSLNINNSCTRKKNFLNFRKDNLIETTAYYKNENMNNLEKFDYLVCGSDQIWCVNKFNEVYYLNLPSKAIKFSYAPSLVFGEYEPEIKEQVFKCLSDFKALSTREKFGSDYISDITNEDVEVVLDPTLLLHRDEWLNIVPMQPKISDKYILTYLIAEDTNYSKQVLEYAEKESLKVVNLSTNSSNNFGDIVIKNAGLEDFLNLIDNAVDVITDSYHGILLSIALNKNFFAIRRFKNDSKINQNGRVEEILAKLKINKNIFNIDEEITYSEINYSVVNKILLKERSNSLKYIEGVLK